jgi:hypothetical protein
MLRLTATLALLALVTALPGSAQTLRGSPTSIERQRTIAVRHDFTFLNTSADVQRFVSLGLLVRVPGGADYELSGVSFPYARPQVRTFIERLSAQYLAACGERLVVTSLTRPLNRQPRNASTESVHPTGLAVDLRMSRRASCQRWLESTLLSLEGRGLAEATRERSPPHYHVVVFPTAYENFVARVTGAITSDAPASAGPETAEYRVGRGDSLWLIAQKFGTNIASLRVLNGITGSRIVPGQRLRVPAERADQQPD